MIHNNASLKTVECNTNGPLQYLSISYYTGRTEKQINIAHLNYNKHSKP